MKLTKHTTYSARHMPQLAQQQQNAETPIGAGYTHYGRGTDIAREEYMATANSHNTSVSQLPIEIDVDPLLKDIVFSEDLEQKKLVMRLYTDIYHNHNIAGSIVDIKSQLMFSEFTLGGILDRKVAEDFQENIDRLDIRTLMPEIDVDYNVKGAFVGSLLYNGTNQVFSRIMPHGYENTKVDQLPFHGTDPLITVAFPESVRSTMQSDSPRVKALREFLGSDVMKQLSNEALELDPKSTVYVPRRGSTGSTANSYYRRVLPWYLMEKNLFRGTLVRSAMRQKGILHVTLDGAGEWEPTIADMQAVMDMFMNADADPIGAVVATRGGISTEEIRDPTGGWTIFDNKDAIDGYIMKALGISDAFLSGDACMVGSTLIPTIEHGLIRIDSLGTSEQKDRKLHDIDITVSSRFGNIKAKKWLYNGKRKTLKIETDLGNELRCTPNHPLLVLDSEELATDWVRSDRLKVGDLLCIPVRETLRTAPLPLNLSEHKTLHKKVSNVNMLTKPEVMTPELAYFLGMFIAEGHWSNGDTRITITNTNVALLNRCADYFEKTFGIAIELRALPNRKGDAYEINGVKGTLNKDCYSVGIGSVQLMTWLEELGVWAQRGEKSMSHYKDVPWCILEADAESQYAFLAAFLEGDGSIHWEKGSIEWVSSSKKVRTKLQLILQAMGFIAYVRKTRVGISSLDSENLFDKLQPYMLEKYIVNLKQRKARNSYFVPGAFVKQLLKERKVKDTRHGSYFTNDAGDEILVTGFKQQTDVNFLYDCYGSGKYNLLISQLKEISESTHEKLVGLLELRYKFVKVTAIKKGKERDVYDISMGAEQEPAFVANGCVVHNTYTNGDTSTSLFIDGVRNERDYLTRKVLYNKIFPMISAMKGYTINNNGKLVTRGNSLEKLDPLGSYERLSDGTRLLIPSVHWEKTLKPEGDQQYMDLLQALTDKGVPVPMRAMTAAAGFNLDRLLATQESDLHIQERVYEYQKNVKELKKKYGISDDAMGGGGGEGGFAANGKIAAMANNGQLHQMMDEMRMLTNSYYNQNLDTTQSDVLARGQGRMVGLANRDFGELSEVGGETHDGKKRWLPNQKLANERANRKIVKMLNNMQAKGTQHNVRRTVTPFY